MLMITYHADAQVKLIIIKTCHIPANTRRSPNVGAMLGQRRRYVTNITHTLGECFMFAAVVGLPTFFVNSLSS